MSIHARKFITVSVPLSLVKTVILTDISRILLHSTDREKVRAAAEWVFTHEPCLGLGHDCNPDLSEFSCLQCETGRDHNNEARRIWLALPEERRQWIASLLEEAGYILQ